MDSTEYSPAGRVARLTTKLKGTFAFSLTVCALAAVVTNRASAAANNIKFLFILLPLFWLSANCLALQDWKRTEAKNPASADERFCAGLRLAKLATVLEGNSNDSDIIERSNAGVRDGKRPWRNHTASAAVACWRSARRARPLRIADAGPAQDRGLLLPRRTTRPYSATDSSRERSLCPAGSGEEY